MMHRRLWSALALGMGMAAGWQALAQGGPDTVYALHGRVIDSVTHRPIAHALVVSGDRRLATMTDHNGNFAIDVSVPAAAVASRDPLAMDTSSRFSQVANLGLMARRPGFLDRGEQTQVTLTKADIAADIILELTPSANVSGVVTGEGAAGAARVQVMLLQHQVQDGALVWTQRASAQTDEAGAFRFGDLEPGEYTVLSNEWPGDDPSYTQVSRQFPPRYLGDVRTLAAATKLNLRAGGGEAVALHLRPATYYPIKVPVQGLPPTTQVQVRVAAQSTAMGYSLGWNRRNSTVEGALPPGEYTLTLESFGAQRSSTRLPLVVNNAPVEHAPVALAVSGTIPVRVHLELAGNPNSGSGAYMYSGPGPVPTQANPVQMYLRNADQQGAGGGNLRHGQGAEAALEGVVPGTYTVDASTIRGYIASMTAGGVDLLHHSLIVGDGGIADPIDVVVRDDGATVTGEVDFAEKDRAHFCSIVLVPTDGGPMRQGFSQNGAKFSVPNIAPGTYRAFAMDPREVQRLPYRDPAAMRAYDALATTVTVAANGQADIKLQLVRLDAAGAKE